MYKMRSVRDVRLFYFILGSQMLTGTSCAPGAGQSMRNSSNTYFVSRRVSASDGSCLEGPASILELYVNALPAVTPTQNSALLPLSGAPCCTEHTIVGILPCTCYSYRLEYPGADMSGDAYLCCCVEYLRSRSTSGASKVSRKKVTAKW